MFEVFGLLARPTPSALPILLALLPLVGAAAAAFGERTRARRTALAVLGVTGVASLLALVWLLRLPSEQRLFLGTMALAARVGQLDLVLAVGLDPFGAFATAAVSAVAARLVAAQRSPRRIALLCALASSVALVVMADGAATLVLAGGVAAAFGAALGRAHGAAFVADRVADVGVVAGVSVLFWALGGSWIDSHYVPELDPRVVVAAGAPAAHAASLDDDDDERPTAPVRRGARATLSLAALPGSSVLLDGVWLRDEHKRLVRSPFAEIPIAAGAHTVRLHVGAGSDDFFVPRVDAAENAAIALAVRGSTTTFREIDDDLVARDAGGHSPGRAAILRRRYFGTVSIAALALGLLALAFAARVRAFPFAPSSDEPARALAALGAVAILARVPLGALTATGAPAIAGALALCASVAGATALRSGRTAPLLAAEIAFAGAGVVAGVPAAAAVHAAIAAVLLARSSAPPSPLAQLALLPSRVAVVGACAGLAHPAAPAVLALVASWVGACALARVATSTAATARAIAATGVVASLALAADARAFGVERPPLAERLLASSFAAVPPSHPASLGLAVLTISFAAFAFAASRTRALERLARSPVVSLAAASAPLASRAAGALARAVAAALDELESRLVLLLRAGDALVRGAASLASVVDAAAFVAATRRARVPVPSDRALRLFLVPLVLVAAAVFVVPWAR